MFFAVCLIYNKLWCVYAYFMQEKGLIHKFYAIYTDIKMSCKNAKG